MHVALVTDTAWLDEELSMFHHLLVGLLDEQVRVAQVVPEGAAEDETSAFGAHITWPDSPWRAVRTHRLRRLARPLREAGVDLIHALHGPLWDGCARLAAELRAPVVLTASAASDLRHVRPILRRARDDTRIPGLAFVASTAPLGEAIAELVPASTPVRVVPPGVRLIERPACWNQADGALCAVVSGDGRFDADYDALLRALSAVIAVDPEAQFFFDGQGTDQHGIWLAAERLGLLPHVSMVPRRLGHRELLMGADVLIHPQALGRSRSVMLQAMVNGLPVLAREDPWLDFLRDGETAWLTERPDASQWSRLLERVVARGEQAAALGDRARDWVSENHVPAKTVERTLALYRMLERQATDLGSTGRARSPRGVRRTTGGPQEGRAAPADAG